MRKSLGYTLFLGLFLAVPVTASAATFIVNSTADPGIGTCDAIECTLREAITAANLSGGADTIDFNIPVASPGFVTPAGVDCDLLNDGVPDSSPCWWRITLLSDLPPITGPTTIDGTTQTGFGGNTNPGTVGSGTKAGVADANPCTPLTFQRPEVAIKGMNFKVFTVNAPAPLDPGPTTIKGLAIYDAGPGDPGPGGVPPTGWAVRYNSGAADPGNLVTHMLIGTKPDGADPLLERNRGFGVEIGGTAALKVESSFVGMNGFGGIVGNASASVLKVQQCEVFENGAGNVTNSAQDGIDLNGVNGLVRCTLSRDNETFLHIPNGGGGNGIELGSKSPGKSSNLVEYNTVKGNDSAGFSDRKGSSENVIQKNVVTDNQVGISVNWEGVVTNRNVISQNSTFMNKELGIDLEVVQSGGALPSPDAPPVQGNTAWKVSPDDTTPNDPCDGDAGSNDVQNFPILNSATSTPAGTTIQGTLDSTPSTTFIVEFFSTPDSSLFGPTDREGEKFLGSTEVTTGADCLATFSHMVPSSLEDDDQLTATATKKWTIADPWSTSEYSNSMPVVEVCLNGKVTGGGHFQSPPGAFTEDTDKEGRANFGVNAKYRPDGTGPTGNTNFQFKAARLHFHSTSYVPFSLVIFDDPPGLGARRAEWKGDGKLNGNPGYCFKVNVHDDKQDPHNTENDRFRIKIWQKPTGGDCADDTPTPIYDNDPTEIGTTLGGGNIVIHSDPCP